MFVSMDYSENDVNGLAGLDEGSRRPGWMKWRREGNTGKRAENSRR